MRFNRAMVVLACAALCHAQPSNQVKHSKIAVYTLKDKAAKVVYEADQLIEAPTFSPDGKLLLVNTGGELYTLPLNSKAPQLEKIDLGGLVKCNNDKGFSPDGKLIALSSSGKAAGSQIYTVAATGGEPKLIVTETPSYFHSFSPDGKYLAFVAQRHRNFDLFRVPAEGGEQQRLTTSEAYDDGPDYSPDGKWIYFNSNRSGSWHIWRMPAEGAGEKDKDAERITNDDDEDWFPHCSPDGKWLVFLSFPKGTTGHNDRMEGVALRMIQLSGKRIKHAKPDLLTTFFGGQGTINVNSWAPDSSKFAYVIYQQ